MYLAAIMFSLCAAVLPIETEEKNEVAFVENDDEQFLLDEESCVEDSNSTEIIFDYDDDEFSDNSSDLE